MNILEGIPGAASQAMKPVFATIEEQSENAILFTYLTVIDIVKKTEIESEAVAWMHIHIL